MSCPANKIQLDNIHPLLLLYIDGEFSESTVNKLSDFIKDEEHMVAFLLMLKKLGLCVKVHTIPC